MEISRPWTGISVGDSGAYSAEQWADSWKTFGIGGAKADSGPLIGSGTSPDIGLTVQANSPAAANVVVTPGSALVEGTWYKSDANVTLTIAANGSGNPRIDTVVLRKDYSAQTVRMAVKQGTPAVTPSPPGLTQTDGVLWEIPLADVAVANGFVSIAAGDITPRRHFANAADGVYLLDLLNNSGGTLVTGDLVIWDTTANRAVTTTTIQGDPKLAGVWVGRTANGAYGRALVRGVGLVNVNGAVSTRHSVLIHSTTAKQAAVAATAGATSKLSSLGVTLETTSGAGLCLAFVDIYPYREPAFHQILRAGAADYTSVNTSFGDVDATNLKITLNLNGTRALIIASFSAAFSNNVGHTGQFDILSVGLGARAGGTNGLALAGSNSDASAQTYAHITIQAIFSGLTPGSNEFKLQFRAASAGTVTIYNNAPYVVMMQGVEL